MVECWICMRRVMVWSSTGSGLKNFSATVTFGTRCKIILKPCAVIPWIWLEIILYGLGLQAGTKPSLVGWLCWGLTSLSTIFQSCRDGAIASWVINQYFRGVKCLAQGHNTAEVGLEPRTSRSGVRHSTTEPPRSPHQFGRGECHRV